MNDDSETVLAERVGGVLPIGRYLTPRQRVQKALGISRATMARYAHAAPTWLLFAVLGLAISRGDRARARQLLRLLTDDHLNATERATRDDLRSAADAWPDADRD